MGNEVGQDSVFTELREYAELCFTEIGVRFPACQCGGQYATGIDPFTIECLRELEKTSGEMGEKRWQRCRIGMSGAEDMVAKTSRVSRDYPRLLVRLGR